MKTIANFLGGLMHIIIHPVETYNAYKIEKAEKKGKDEILPSEVFDIFNEEVVKNIESNVTTSKIEISKPNEKSKFSFSKGKKKKKDEIIPEEEYEKLQSVVDEKLKGKTQTSKSNQDIEEQINNTTSKEKPSMNSISKVYDYLSDSNLDVYKLDKIVSLLDHVIEFEEEYGISGLKERLSNFVDNGSKIKPEERFEAVVGELDDIIKYAYSIIENINTKPYDETDTFDLEEDEENISIENKVLEFLSDSNIDEKQKKDILRSLEYIKDYNMEKELESYIDSVGNLLLPNIKYEIIMGEIDGLINSAVDSKNTSESVTETNNDLIESESITETSDIIVDELENKTEASYVSYEEKCKKYYDLYQERMEKIQTIEDEVIALKEYLKIVNNLILDPIKQVENKAKIQSKIRKLESEVEALSIRISILERNEYVKAYQEKLDSDKADKLDNHSILETFSDEELDKLYSSGLYENQEKMETILEFKKMMKM